MTATRNACKLCTPLGAAWAFKGVAGAVSLLHGSQGCSTYIRRYMISHFREPMDIASSNFTEETAVFGGKSNLHTALDNLESQYHPSLIAVATTCLAETIGEDMPRILREYQEGRTSRGLSPLPLIWVSTAAYRGTHADGFQASLRAMVSQLCTATEPRDRINLFPGMVSPEDLRYLKSLCRGFGLDPVILPDYSRTLDGGPWKDWTAIPPGGTGLHIIRQAGGSTASLEFTGIYTGSQTPAGWLEENLQVPRKVMPMPLGLELSDRLTAELENLSGLEAPDWIEDERDRLADAYADAHKYLQGRKAMVYGEEDLALSLSLFLREIGITPVLVATGGQKGRLESAMEANWPGYTTQGVKVVSEVDFMDMEETALGLTPNIILGHSKGYKLAKTLKVPLLRLGFPVHDRFGGARIPHIGYRGTLNLLDRIVNTLLEEEQSMNPVGYTYFG